jgi:hypothetical protein
MRPAGLRNGTDGATRQDVERRIRKIPLPSGIDRRRQDEDYAERMIGGARLTRTRSEPHGRPFRISRDGKEKPAPSAKG